MQTLSGVRSSFQSIRPRRMPGAMPQSRSTASMLTNRSIGWFGSEKRWQSTPVARMADVFASARHSLPSARNARPSE